MCLFYLTIEIKVFGIITNGTTAITFLPTIGVNCTDVQRSRAASTAYCTAYTSSLRINCTFLSALVVTSEAPIGRQMPRRESQNIVNYRSIVAHQHCLLVIVANRRTTIIIHCEFSIFFCKNIICGKKKHCILLHHYSNHFSH